MKLNQILKENIVRNVMAVLLVLAAPVVFGGCSSDSDDEDENVSEQEVRGIDATVDALTPSANVQAFFDAELPSKGYVRFFEAEDGIYPDETEWGLQFCKLINSEEELRSIYRGAMQLPDIDFATTTLVVGRSYNRDYEYVKLQNVDNITLLPTERGYKVEVDVTTKKFCWGEASFNGIVVFELLFHYWALFPKIQQQDIEVVVQNRIVE
ncbi:MAG: hypothetical protein IJ841_08585 [Prevotella sp.]|nr:hypothetical protein [Prevotella sp.]